MSIIIKTELDDIRDIVAKHPEAWKKVLDDGDIYDDTDLYEDLYEYYSSDPDYMPYGTQKARDGDPVQWITERLDDLGAFNPAEWPEFSDKHQGREDAHSHLDYEDEISDEEQERANHIAKSQDRGEL